MQSKNRYLQGSLFPQLPEPSQADLITALEPSVHLLWDILMVPWEDLQRRRGEESDKFFVHLNEDEAAVWLTIQAAHRARAILDGKDGFRLKTLNGKLILILEEKAAIVIKKLTRRRNKKKDRRELTRSNKLTRTNQDLWEQRKTTELPDLPRLILGYELLEEITQIKFYIAYPRTRGRGVEWAYLIPPQAGAKPTIHVPSTSPEPERRKGFTITASEETRHGKRRKGSDKG